MEIEKSKLDSMLADVPENQRDEFLTDFKRRGYTIKGTAEPQMTTGQAALEATKQALGTPIPVIGGSLGAAQKGLESAAGQAERFYGPETTMGKIAGKGGRALAGAIPVTMGDATMQALAGPILEGAGAIAKPVGKVAGDVLSELIAHVSSSTPEAVKAVFENPSLMKQARQLIGDAEQSRLVKVIGDNVSTLGSKIRDFETEFAKFAERDPKNLPLRIQSQDISKKIAGNLVGEGFNIPKELSGVEPRLIDRIKSSSERDEIAGFLKTLNNTKDMTWGDALNLKRQLDDAINYGHGGGLAPRGDSAQHALKMIRAEVKTALSESLPEDKRAGWDAANKAYSDAMKGYEELKKNAVGASPEKTASKLLNRLKKGYQDIGINEQASKIGEGALKELQKLQDQVSAGTFKKYVSGFGPGGFAQVLPTSPYLMGQTTAMAGRLSQLVSSIAEQAAKHPLATRAAMQSAKKKVSE